MSRRFKAGDQPGHYIANGPVSSEEILRMASKLLNRRFARGRTLCSPEEAKAFVAMKLGHLGHEDAAMITLMAAAGLRRSEVVCLAMDDFDRRRGRLVVRAGKGGRQRELVLPGMVRRDLAQWLRVRGRAGGPLFCPLTVNGCMEIRTLSAQRLYDVVVERAFAAGIERCTPHDLRRTFVTQLLSRDVDLNTVRQLAGHSDIQTTARYDRRDEGVLRRALRQSGAVLPG